MNRHQRRKIQAMKRNNGKKPKAILGGFGLSQEEAIRKSNVAFEGQHMTCVMCGAKRKSDPAVSSDWRSIEVDHQVYYACVNEFPPDGSSAEAFRTAYDKIVRKILDVRRSQS